MLTPCEAVATVWKTKQFISHKPTVINSASLYSPGKKKKKNLETNSKPQYYQAEKTPAGLSWSQSPALGVSVDAVQNDRNEVSLEETQERKVNSWK